MAWSPCELRPDLPLPGHRDIGGGQSMGLAQSGSTKAATLGPRTYKASRVPGTLPAKVGHMPVLLRSFVTGLVALAACSSPPATHHGPPPTDAVSVELGTTGGDDGLTFVPFASGQVLKLE